jgi:hypothetical protein
MTPWCRREPTFAGADLTVFYGGQTTIGDVPRRHPSSRHSRNTSTFRAVAGGKPERVLLRILLWSRTPDWWDKMTPEVALN